MATNRLVLRKDGKALWAADDHAQEVFRSVKNGTDVIVEFKTARNPKHTRLFWALMRDVVKSGAWKGDAQFGADEEGLVKWIKYEFRMFDAFVLGEKVCFEFHSIGEEKMTQAVFSRFFDRAIWLICDRLLKDPEWQAFRDRFVEQIEGRWRDPRDR